MLSDEFPEETTGVRSPTSLGGTTASVSLTVDDADRWFERAVDAGTTASGLSRTSSMAARASPRSVWPHLGDTRTG